MKKSVLGLFLVALIFGACAGNQNPSITIVNNTGLAVSEVFISQTASDTWGSNLMPSRTLANGDSSSFRLPFAIDVVNRYDVRLVDSEGDAYIQWNVLVSPDESLVFSFADFDLDNHFSFEGPPITISNDTGYPVYEIYISPSDFGSWGLNRMAQGQILSDGESLTLRLPFGLDKIDIYDIMLVDSDEDFYLHWDLPLNPNETIVFTFDDIGW